MEYDLTKGGLLTRAFARAAKSPERAKKAEELLNIMRERGDRKMTVREYKRKYVDVDR